MPASGQPQFGRLFAAPGYLERPLGHTQGTLGCSWASDAEKARNLSKTSHRPSKDHWARPPTTWPAKPLKPRAAKLKARCQPCRKGGDHDVKALCSGAPLILALPAFLLAQAIDDRPYKSLEEAYKAMEEPLYSNCEPVKVVVSVHLWGFDRDTEKAKEMFSHRLHVPLGSRSGI